MFSTQKITDSKVSKTLNGSLKKSQLIFYTSVSIFSVSEIFEIQNRFMVRKISMSPPHFGN